MQVETQIEIAKPKALVWRLVTDIEHASDMLTGLSRIEILKQPAQGLVGLTWRETRTVFGKEATEVMWITEAVEQAYYCTRAESHGTVYTSRLSVTEQDGSTKLTMTFNAKPHTLMAKILSAVFKGMIKKSINSAFQQDLADIKHFAEQLAEAA